MMRSLGIGALLAFCGATATLAEAPEPPGAVSAHAAAYVATINSGAPQAVQQFRQDDISPGFAGSVPERAFEKYFLNQHRVTGGVELAGIRMRTPQAAELVLRDRVYGALHGLELTLEETDDRRIANLEPMPTPAWALPDARRRSPAVVGREALSLMAKGCEAKVFSGAILVAQGDQVLAQAACGEASRRYHVKNDVETRFNLGSMNKMLTAAAVMQLVEAGKVALDDPLSKYADETWLPRAISDRITVAQLLSHTSGLGSFFSETFTRSSRELYRALDDYKPLVRGESLSFAPGTRFQYSDTGMLMLGVVIEKASGETYFDYVRRHIYGPAGMTASDSYPMDEPVENLAMGYAYAPNDPYGWRENTFAHVFQGGPAGGGFSTVGDLYRFARALRDGKLVSPRSLGVLWTDHPPNHYGAGFDVTQTAAGKIVGHQGFFSGVSAELDLYTERDYVVVVLSNIDNGAPALADAIRDKIAQTAP